MTLDKKQWTALTPEQKRQHRFDCWLNPDFEFASPEAEANYKARVQRFIDAVCLEKTPDRVPVCATMGFFPAWHAGLTPYDAMHDTDRAFEAWYQFNLEFQPDCAVSPALYTIPASVLEILDLKHYSWPGRGCRHDAGYQYHEGEFMTADEYDELIEDPTFFLFRRVLPRFVGAYKGIAKLATPHDMRALVLCPPHVASWGDPDVQDSLLTLMVAGRRMREWFDGLAEVSRRIMAQGFPDLFPVVAEAPFDVVGDNLRGTRGIMLDLYQRPEKVIAACDRMVDIVFRSVLEKTTPDSIPGVFMPLHKGLDTFMSPEHFKTFYWPSLKKLILKLIDEGFVPWLFTEGKYNTRLEIIKDLPKGKVVYWFNTTDIFKAKEVLGSVGCIHGGVPVSMMTACEPEEVTAYCRRLIETVGAGGGYILDLGAGPEKAKAENLHAMIRAAKEYGVYKE
ncbi:MAG: hypothetical protein N3B14_04005 [Thermoleophilia bacterium]|nr:hypothetical protein [Thermoleophilia bacterium]